MSLVQLVAIDLIKHWNFVCFRLKIAGYFCKKTLSDILLGTTDPSRLSARAHREALLSEEVRRVRAENRKVYGARKVWRQLNRKIFLLIIGNQVRFKRKTGKHCYNAYLSGGQVPILIRAKFI
ncbi:MAG: hypothetical protein GY780_05160 [bacterium]|nr:hypothetical protein [bacterium]